MKIGHRLAGVLIGVLIGIAAPAAADDYAGNGGVGFGGVIGASTLTITESSGNLDFLLVKGALDLNDALVIYIDSRAGGFASTLTLSDQLDLGRQAISGLAGGNRALVNLPFEADFAIVLEAGAGANLFELAAGGNGSLLFVADLGGSGFPDSPSFAFSASLTDLAIGSGASLRFVGTYLAAANGFRSDEGFGQGLPVGNPGIPSTVTYTSGELFAIPAVPTASIWGVALLTSLLCGAGLLGLGARRDPSAS